MSQDKIVEKVGKNSLQVFTTGGNHSREASVQACNELVDEHKKYVENRECALFFYPRKSTRILR